jgi:hypothetical protein
MFLTERVIKSDHLYFFAENFNLFSFFSIHYKNQCTANRIIDFVIRITSSNNRSAEFITELLTSTSERRNNRQRKLFKFRISFL